MRTQGYSLGNQGFASSHNLLAIVVFEAAGRGGNRERWDRRAMRAESTGRTKRAA